MKTAVQLFDFEGAVVRVMLHNGEYWWNLTDVCAVLGLSNPSVVVDRLDEDERSKFGLGRQGETWHVNEPGLYTVILRSEKPEAKAFKRWITHEVLPSIRKTGGYMLQWRKEDVKARAVDNRRAEILIGLANDKLTPQERKAALLAEADALLVPREPITA